MNLYLSCLGASPVGDAKNTVFNQQIIQIPYNPVPRWTLHWLQRKATDFKSNPPKEPLLQIDCSRLFDFVVIQSNHHIASLPSDSRTEFQCIFISRCISTRILPLIRTGPPIMSFLETKDNLRVQWTCTATWAHHGTELPHNHLSQWSLPRNTALYAFHSIDAV